MWSEIYRSRDYELCDNSNLSQHGYPLLSLLTSCFIPMFNMWAEDMLQPWTLPCDDSQSLEVLTNMSTLDLAAMFESDCNKNSWHKQSS